MFTSRETVMVPNVSGLDASTSLARSQPSKQTVPHISAILPTCWYAELCLIAEAAPRRTRGHRKRVMSTFRMKVVKLLVVGGA